jgi:hypothetical protein
MTKEEIENKIAFYEGMSTETLSDEARVFNKEQVRRLRDELDRIASGELKPEATDKEVGGSHYKLPIQPIEFIERNGLGFCEGNVIKYVCRYKQKGGAQDLDKAIHYLELLKHYSYGL